MGRAQVALEHFQLLAVFQTDQLVGGQRFLDRHRRLLIRFGRRLVQIIQAGQARIDEFHYSRNLRYCN